MNERLTHRRSKGPVSTPATRLVELQNELAHTQRLLAEAEAETERLQQDNSLYHTWQGVSFGGIPMAQMRCDLMLWETVLNDNPQLQAIFELGTWFGGFGWWLWAQSQARDLHFETYDMTVSEHKKPPGFRRIDVFAERQHLGEVFREWEPCLVFCDNGNKPREMAEYSLEIRHPESLLVVHDWGTEFQPEDVPDGVAEVYGDFCDQIGSMTRVFRLKGER